MEKEKKIGSKEVSSIREDMAQLRRRIKKLYLEDNIFPKDNIDHVEGLLTCGIVALYHKIEDLMEIEIERADRENGKSYFFNSRGIGSDHVPSCFISKQTDSYYHNIAAFVKSKAEGEEIVSWFGGSARLDYREYEPNYIQVKIGVIDKYFAGLTKLHQLTHYYKRIRKCDVEEAIKYGLENPR